MTPGVTNCRASRSPVQIITSMPSASALVVSVAITSSASKFSAVSTSIRRAPSTSLMSSTWPLKSAGDVERFALYSANSSLRQVCRDRSKVTAMWVGRSSRSRLISMEVKPYTAFVGWPVVVENFSTGSAKNAR